jgi:hypothetical protein
VKSSPFLGFLYKGYVTTGLFILFKMACEGFQAVPKPSENFIKNFGIFILGL